MPTAWDAPGAEEAAKKKTKRKKGTWKNHAERYTEAKMDEAPIYMTKLGKKSTEAYPQEIQEELRKLATRLQESGDSQQMEYDMTDGWVYNLRLIATSERELWEKYLAKYGVDWVGAQWNNMTGTSPPDSFDEDVMYRPIYIKEDHATEPMNLG